MRLIYRGNVLFMFNCTSRLLYVICEMKLFIQSCIVKPTKNKSGWCSYEDSLGLREDKTDHYFDKTAGMSAVITECPLWDSIALPDFVLGRYQFNRCFLLHKVWMTSTPFWPFSKNCSIRISYRKMKVLKMFSPCMSFEVSILPGICCEQSINKSVLGVDIISSSL